MYDCEIQTGVDAKLNTITVSLKQEMDYPLVVNEVNHYMKCI